jgi:alkylhydroperoxidase family enzyme
MPFVSEPAGSGGQEDLYRQDLQEDRFVWDSTRLWSHQPHLWNQLVELIGAAAEAAGLSRRDKAMLVLGTASTLGDSYCSIAWARFLTEWADADTARAVLQRDDGPLTGRERALAAWARKLAADPNATTPGDVQVLRDAGIDDRQIVALTFYGALRIALSTTNDALGARPDVALADMLDPVVRSVITWGRRPA